MKIPPQAKRVFKGIIFDVYQWEQDMFDGSKATFEMLKRPNTIEIVAMQDGKILMTHQSQPTKPDFYSLFSGRAEEGEEPLVTAKRELLEEGGLTSDQWELYKVFEPAHKIDWEIHIFIARNCKKVQGQNLDPGEKIEVLAFEFDEFINVLLSDKCWDTSFGYDLAKEKINGTLEQFKSRLFNGNTSPVR